MPKNSRNDTERDRDGSTVSASSGRPPNKNRNHDNQNDKSLFKLRTLKIGLSVSIVPLIALALYLYWLTLPEYEPTGNEVYDAFAPAVHTKALYFDATCRIVRLQDQYGCTHGIWGTVAYCMLIPITRKLDNTDFYATIHIRNERDIQQPDSFELHCMKYIVGYEEDDYAVLEKTAETNVCDAGTYLLVLRKKQRESLLNTAIQAVGRYPDYSVWYLKIADDKMGFALFTVNEPDCDENSPEYKDAISSLAVAQDYMKMAIAAPLNASPPVYPFDIAICETSNSKPLCNRRIAYWFLDKSGSYKLRVYSYRGSHLLDSYYKHIVEYDFIDDYLRFLNQSIRISENDKMTRKTLMLGSYIWLYDEITTKVIDLTPEQTKEYRAFHDELEKIDKHCESLSDTAAAAMLNNELGYYVWLKADFEIQNYVISELAKLDPPTIEEWLAGGATLKPRQGSASAQGAAATQGTASSQSSGSQSQSSTAQQSGTGNSQTTP